MKSISIAILIVLGACGDDANLIRGEKGTSAVHEEPLESDFIRYIGQKAKIECGIESGCSSETVAIYNLISVTDVFDYSVCTGVMIASDVLVTNLHCILDKEGQVKTRCDKDIAIQDTGQNVSQCAKIMTSPEDLANFKEELPFSTRDLALIKLKKSPNLVFALLSHSGFTHDEKYTLDTIEFSSDIQKPARLVRKSCRYTEENEAIPFVHSEDQTFASLSGCNLHSGNSGSGLKDAGGELVGLVFAKLDSEIISSIWREKMNEYHLSMHHSAFDDYYAGVALSFACLNPEYGQGVTWKNSPECMPDVTDQFTEANISRTFQSILGKIAEDVELEQDYFDTFQYRVIHDGQKLMFSPTCLKPTLFQNIFAGKRLSEISLNAWQITPTVTFDQESGSFRPYQFDQMNLNMEIEIKSDVLSDKTSFSNFDIAIKDCK